MAMLVADGSIVETAIAWEFNDGGRADAGYRGSAGDCVVRSIAIATDQDYKTVYKALQKLAGKTPRNGVTRKVYDAYLRSIGWTWVPTMGFGTGCRVHLKASELPTGRMIARLTKHVCAVIDRTVHDTYDPSRGGTRCVYGVYVPREDAAQVRAFFDFD